MTWEVEGLRDKERDLLDAILRFGGLVEACGSLGISPAAGRQRLYRLRRRYRKAKALVEAYERYSIRVSDRVRRYL